ncbi:MAG: PAS domain S-box protein [Deltaproteobacteria bacterium]|nr:PAS domain S-box protein [Deltaproteobacteria bacterium]
MAGKPTYEELEQRVKILEKKYFKQKRAEEKLKHQKKRLESLIEYSSLAIVTLDEGHNIISCNRDFEKLFYFKESEMVGRNLDELIVGQEYIEDALLYTKETLKGRAIHGSGKRQRKDGAHVYVEFMGVPVIIDGKVVGAYGIYQDISDRKQAEKELREGERFLQDVFDAIKDGISVLDNNLKIVRVNSWMEEMYSKEKKLTGRKCYEVYQMRDTPCPWCPSLKTIETGEIHNAIVPYPSKENPTGWIELSSFPLKNIEGDTVGVIEYAKDITQQKRSEESLRVERDNLHNIFESIEDGIYIVNQQYDIQYCNPVLVKDFGPYEGRKCYEYFHDRDEVCPWCKSQDVWSGKTVHWEWFSFKNDRTYDLMDTPMTLPDGSIGKLEIFRDITERKQLERELRIRNQIADVFLFVPDDEMYAGVLEVVLEALESKFGIFGYIDEKGDLVCPSMTRDVWDQCRISDKDIRFPCEQWGDSIWGRAMVGKEALYSNKPFKVPKGHIPITKALDVPIIHQGEAIGNFLVGNKETVYGEKERHLLENISNFIAPVLHARLQKDTRERDKRRLETQLRQAQKMEAIGTLAGGIAHDFNNILAAIIGYVELVKMKLPEDSEVLPDLDQILKSGFRAKSLVQQILAFSREQELKQRPLQLKYIVKESIKLLRSTLPADIEIKEYIAEDVDIVNSDPTQMQQIIMNLCTNACHAMQKEGGIISVGLGNVELDDIASAQHMDLDPGIYLRLTVGDTGSGMTSEVMDRIFDPYFTTKDTGIGTGMGLPIVHGIVKNHDGGIIVYSEPGKGSTFHVYLPIAKEVEEHPEAREKETLPRGHERILFVDDEPALAELGKQMLERFGYEVTATASSIDALEMFRSQPDRFDLVMTDMVMPKIRGDRLAKKLVEIRPDIPIIICTGRSEQMSEEKTKRIGIKALVMKPYVMKDLASIVRKVIDGL